MDTFYWTLIISFLTVLPLSLYANLSLALQSASWRVAQLLGSLRSFFASPSLGRGWVASPLNQAASKIQTLQYALQSFKNSQGIVPKMKKPTFMQQ